MTTKPYSFFIDESVPLGHKKAVVSVDTSKADIQISEGAIFNGGHTLIVTVTPKPVSLVHHISRHLRDKLEYLNPNQRQQREYIKHSLTGWIDEAVREWDTPEETTLPEYVAAYIKHEVNNYGSLLNLDTWVANAFEAYEEGAR